MYTYTERLQTNIRLSTIKYLNQRIILDILLFYILLWSQTITRNFILKDSTPLTSIPKQHYKVELCSWQGEPLWNL